MDRLFKLIHSWNWTFFTLRLPNFCLYDKQSWFKVCFLLHYPSIVLEWVLPFDLQNVARIFLSCYLIVSILLTWCNKYKSVRPNNFVTGSRLDYGLRVLFLKRVHNLYKDTHYELKLKHYTTKNNLSAALMQGLNNFLIKLLGYVLLFFFPFQWKISCKIIVWIPK